MDVNFALIETKVKNAKTVSVIDVSGQTRHRKECRPMKARKVFICYLRKLHSRFATVNWPEARWGVNQMSRLSR